MLLSVTYEEVLISRERGKVTERLTALMDQREKKDT